MTDDIVWKETLMLTASCVMNLYASGQIESMLSSLPIVPVCDGRVSASEHYCIYVGFDEDGAQRKKSINIQPFIEKGLLHVASTDSHVLENAAKIASLGMIDDGETIPCAMALAHDWMLVTDDLYALNLFAMYKSLHLL